MGKIEWAAGFLPQNGSKALGIGYQEGKAATLRVADMGAVLIKKKDMTYQKKTGPLMANSHPGSYSGQDAYNDMFVTEKVEKRKVGGCIWTTSKQNHQLLWSRNKGQALMATDYKDPPIVLMSLED